MRSLLIVFLCGACFTGFGVRASWRARNRRDPARPRCSVPPRPWSTVDAIITDQSGNFVPGLEAGDLQLFEDGKPQPIEQFYMVTHDLALRADLPGELTGNTQRADHRLFIIMFDEGHLAVESLSRVKHGAEQFVTTFMGAGDLGGVFLNGGMFRGRLTTDRGELLEAIRAVKPGIREPPGAPRPVPRVADDPERARRCPDCGRRPRADRSARGQGLHRVARRCARPPAACSRSRTRSRRNRGSTSGRRGCWPRGRCRTSRP